jgi:hypothetical protein
VKLALALVTTFCATAASAAPLPVTLPSPSLRAPGGLIAFAGAGARVALATWCDVRVANLVRGAAPVRLKRVGDCREDPLESAVGDVHLGATTIAALVILAPSPHAAQYSLWMGPLPVGPLRKQGEEWGWFDSDVPSGYGCAWTVVSGGGSVVRVQGPNRLAVDNGIDAEPACPSRGSTQVTLSGRTSATFTLQGSWTLLATDGKRVAVARLDDEGAPTGELALVDSSGRRLRKPSFPARTVRAAYDGWLTPRGLVLRAPRRIVGPGWTVTGVGGYPEAAIAEGRLLYLARRVVHVRRLHDGADRALVTLPPGETFLAAGSFGLAVAISTEERTSVYRVPWRTIDHVLPR